MNNMESRQESFFNYLKHQLDSIELLTSNELKIHKKILYVSFIDTLAGLIYPTYSNRERFTELVRNFGAWKDADKVSSPHLLRALKLNPDPAYDRIRKLIAESMSEWKEGDQIALDKDLDAAVVGTHWPTGKRYEQPVDGAAWVHLKHVELFYAYRNALIHEFRPLGTDLESWPDDSIPYYLSCYEITKKGAFSELTHWDLIYPSVFLKNLTTNILDSTRVHIAQAGIDPIDVMRSGKYWVKELNK